MSYRRTPRTHQEKCAATTALEVDGLAKTTRIKRRQGRGLPTDWIFRTEGPSTRGRRTAPHNGGTDNGEREIIRGRRIR